jgi:hypothetical protein
MSLESRTVLWMRVAPQSGRLLNFCSGPMDQQVFHVHQTAIFSAEASTLTWPAVSCSSTDPSTSVRWLLHLPVKS